MDDEINTLLHTNYEAIEEIYLFNKCFRITDLWFKVDRLFINFPENTNCSTVYLNLVNDVSACIERPYNTCIPIETCYRLREAS